MCIHGDKSQPERDWVLNGEFRTEHCPYSVLGMGRLSVKGQEVNIFCFANCTVACVTVIGCDVIAKRWS